VKNKSWNLGFANKIQTYRSSVAVSVFTGDTTWLYSFRNSYIFLTLQTVCLFILTFPHPFISNFTPKIYSTN